MQVCVCVRTVCVCSVLVDEIGHAECLGGESTTTRTTSPSPPDIYPTVESNR